MRRPIYPVAALLAGLIVAQVLSTIFVYRSNLEIYHQTAAMAKSGFLTVPNPDTAENLLGWLSALAGGFFYTATIGLGLAAAGLAAAWLHSRLRKKIRRAWLVPPVVWVAVLVPANFLSVSCFLNLNLLLVPLAAFLTARRLMTPASGEKTWPAVAAFLAPVALLGLIWGGLTGGGLFIEVRDYLFWSNPPGRALADFYYRNTMYPAESFKSLNQKTLRAVRVEGTPAVNVAGVRHTLILNDYLPVNGDVPLDLRVDVQGDQASFFDRDREIFQADLKQYLSNPWVELERYSNETDRQKSLRRAVLFSLLAGMPAGLYVLIFSLAWLAASLIGATGARGVFAAAGVCLFFGLLLLGPVLYGRSNMDGDPAELLASDSWWKQTAGLKLAIDKNLEIADFPDYKKLAESPSVPVRYWLARGLGLSRTDATYPELLKMLKDPHPNVVYIASQSIGLRNRPNATDALIALIQSSDHWYVQWYAYRGLRSLGWRQKP